MSFQPLFNIPYDMPDEDLDFDPYADYCEFCGGDLDEVLIRYGSDKLLLSDGTYLTIDYADRYVDICWICL